MEQVESSLNVIHMHLRVQLWFFPFYREFLFGEKIPVIVVHYLFHYVDISS